MLVGKKTLELREELARLRAENAQLRERLARYEELEEEQRRQQADWEKQFGAMMSYTGTEDKL